MRGPVAGPRRTALRPRTGVVGSGSSGDRTHPSAEGFTVAGQRRNLTGFAGLPAARARGPGTVEPTEARAAVKAAWMISYRERFARLWHTEVVHLLPADRADHRIIDSERVCQAIAALGDPGDSGSARSSSPCSPTRPGSPC